jgi:colanic acid biosynthesis glycosyl transferase WcaI
VSSAKVISHCRGNHLKTIVPSALFINRVYPPDGAATGQILADLAITLTTLGWKVTVITSRTVTGAEEYEVCEGVEIVRLKALPFTRSSHWQRAISYLSFYPLVLWRALRLPRTDVVVTMTDPPLLLVMGVFLKWFKRNRLVHWAQDLYPEVAQTLGVVRAEGIFGRLLKYLSTWGVQHHDGIVCIGRCMRERLLARGIDDRSIAIIPNWINTEQVHPLQPDKNPFYSDNGLPSFPLVMYSGNLGLAHPFDAMLKAAKILSVKMPEAQIVFVGDGPNLSYVQSKAQQEQLTNVRFLPFQPREKLAESLSAATIHLASMHDEMVGLVVPSKVYGILAAGRPCIFLGPAQSEAAQLIREYQCGTVLPGSVDGAVLADTLIEWLNNPTRLQRAGANARRVAEQGSLENAARAFDALLKQFIQPSPLSEIPEPRISRTNAN